jgi:hypothetical protein
MARHAAVDLTLIFRAPARPPTIDRLPEEKCRRLEQILRQAGLALHDDGEAGAKLRELRAMYEPFLSALAQRFLLTLPVFLTESEPIDNWQRSPGFRAPGLEKLPIIRGADEHFGA